MRMRFGFAVKVIGHGGNIATIDADAGMPSNDARRGKANRMSARALNTSARYFTICTKRTFTCILCSRILRLT